MKDNKIKILEDNQLKEYSIYKICQNEKFGKSYIIYTDNTNYYAASYTTINNKVIINNIDTEEEWNYIDMELNKDE